jgi:CxxC motif-containing protein
MIWAERLFYLICLCCPILCFVFHEEINRLIRSPIGDVPPNRKPEIYGISFFERSKRRLAAVVIVRHGISVVAASLIGVFFVSMALTIYASEPIPNFSWPVTKGDLLVPFGSMDGKVRNEGINIAAKLGTPVLAAADGLVAYAGDELKGYGKLILIRHEGLFSSAYAHNQDLKVSRGDNVGAGDEIATVGQTGEVSQPQLHFELRYGAAPVNPIFYLPPVTASQ